MQTIEILSPMAGAAGTIWTGMLLLLCAAFITIPQGKLIIRVTNRIWLASAITCLGLYFIALSITSGAKLQPYLTEDRIVIAFILRIILLAGFALNATIWAAVSVRKHIIIQ